MTEAPGLPTTFGQLGKLGRDIDVAVTELSRLDQERIHSEADYKAEFARVFREATGSVEDRKQQAVLACNELWRVWSLAESAVKMQQHHLKALHARVDVGRSIFSAQKAEMAFANSGATP